MKYLSEFKRLAVGRDFPGLSEETEAPAAAAVSEANADPEKLQQFMRDAIDYRRDVDRAYGEMPLDNLEALVTGLKGHISAERHASLKAAVDGVGLGRLIDVLDDVRIELKNMIEPPKGAKKSGGKPVKKGAWGASKTK